MTNSLLVEYLNFAPIHFIDDNLNAANSNLYKATANLEHQLGLELSSTGGADHEQELEKGLVAIETLLEKSIDSKFDRWELYCLKNILCLPAGVDARDLPHYKDLDLRVTLEQEQELDLELDRIRALKITERWKKAKLLKQQEKVQSRLAELKKLQESLEGLKATAVEAGVFPVADNANRIKGLVEEVNQVVSEVEARTSTTNWTTVPLIGASKGSLATTITSEVLYQLEKAQGLKSAPSAVSAWDITKEYREAISIGSARNIEALAKAV
ncbi:hypothetical protein HDV03_000927 [Kappamyces sp. JEL0829]|nr:hypothetical protein HDV03_000927 [Kappamyces sp. JEL0829]